MRISFPDKLKYAKTHEWVKMKGDVATIGVTAYILKRLGALIYLDLPQVDDELLAGDAFGEIESLHGISDLICPMEGTVIKINKRLLEDLEILIGDPYVNGWLMKMRVEDPEQINSLMSAEEYKNYIDLSLLGKR